MTILPRNGERFIGKDGLTVEDMRWVFDFASGAIGVGQGKMIPQDQNKMTGAYSKPKQIGQTTEERNGAPGFSFTEARAIYDEAETLDVPISHCVLRRMNRDTTTQEVLRKIIQAPEVYVMANRELVVTPPDIDAIDGKIEDVLGVKKA